MNPANPDVAKRSLLRWIAGTVQPGPVSVAAIAAALGCDPSELSVDDEEDPSMREAFDLFVALMQRLDALRSQTATSGTEAP